jgi:hypothetical protein
VVATALGIETVEVEEHERGPSVYFEANGVEIGVHVADPAKNCGLVLPRQPSLRSQFVCTAGTDGKRPLDERCV